jgi:uncharacterized sulfatase
VLSKSGALNTFQAQWLAEKRPPVEFYDLKTDPQGLHDLSSHPDQASRLATMKQHLDDWIQASGDQGAAGDPATEPSMDTIRQDKRADYQRAWKARLKKPEPTDEERLAWWLQSYGLEKE